MDKQKIDYVVILGYVAILFGRSRNTEDVDLFIEEMGFEKFLSFWNALDGAGFECINESNSKKAYDYYLRDMLALRFAIKGTYLPNFELKFPKSDNSKYSLRNKVAVIINGKKLKISKLEPQIAYKLYLGSDKDIEDAIHLWRTFKGNLDPNLFGWFVKSLGVEEKISELD